MKIIVRTFLALLLVGVLVVSAAVLMLLTFNPNDHKDRLIAVVKEKTGRDMAIAGDIGVMFYPVLGFQVEGLTLGNPPGFPQEDFLSVGEAQAGVRLIPLIQRKVELAKIRLVAPQITVIRKADGTNNLDFSHGKAAAGEDAAAAAPKDGTPALDLSVDGVEIRNAKVTYIDRQSGKETRIDPLNLDFPGWSAGQSVPVSLDMVVQNGPDSRIGVKASADVKADPRGGTYDVRNIDAAVTANGMKINAGGHAAVDQKAETIALTDMKAGWSGTSVSGKAAVKGFKNPSVTFDLSSPSVDVDALTASLKPAGGGNGGGSAAPGKAQDGTLVPVDLVRKLSMDGRIAIDTLKTAGMTLSGVNVGVRARDGVVTADPVAMKLYDGTVSAVAKLDARGATPAVTVTGKATDLQLATLMKEKMGQDYLSGLAQTDFDLNARGNSPAALTNTSGGTLRIALGDGYINKWQLSRLINQAIAYFETGSLNPNASDKVYFTSLDATFRGNQGVFRNDDLVLTAPKSHALGAGNISLRDKSVDYTVRVGLGDDPARYGDRKHLPIRITGPFSGPRYAIDLESMAMQAAQEKIEEKKQELLDKALGKLGGKAGEGEAGTTPEPATQILDSLFGGRAR